MSEDDEDRSSITAERRQELRLGLKRYWKKRRRALSDLPAPRLETHIPEVITSLDPPKTDQAHAASSETSRKQLRFRGNRRKVTPHGYLYFDQCLDRFGLHRLGSSWDDMVRLRNFPFQYVSRQRAFVRYSISEKRPYKRLDHPIIVQESECQQFQAASQRYKNLFEELSEAIQSRQFKALLIEPDGRLTEISHPAIFAAQVVLAFYTGMVRMTEGGNWRRRRILVEDESFTRWLEKGNRPNLRTLGSNVFAPLLPEIVGHATENGYKLTEVDFCDLLLEAARAFESPIEINGAGIRKLWNDDALKPVKKAQRGRPAEAMTRLFTLNRPSLLELMIAKLAAQRPSALVVASGRG
ncbi:hypothetical protein NKI12_30920 [Mesorhizobium australicum]|uniref:Uncharacterized protein n=1 Tax=Mesorhizobium australicum TaxID=536018 RepID=A0ACC6T2T7_9HYPH